MTTYQQRIWVYLIDRIKNEYGVAGLMGNLFAESGLRPNNLQNSYEWSLGYTDDSYTEAVDNGTYTKNQFVHDSAGYGLAQWTYWNRKQRLYEMWQSGGYTSIGSIDLALDYLWYEISNNLDILNTLKNAKDIRQASDKILHDFEKPEDQSESVEKLRYDYSVNIYAECKGIKAFRSRTDIHTPSEIKDNFHYYSQNPFYPNYQMPNCTCYAWGRFWEIADVDNNGSNKPNGLPTGNGGEWYPQLEKLGNDSPFEIGQTPKLGAVACWSKPNDFGHAAIVEEILSSGDIITSNSAWGSTFFYTKPISKSNGYNFGSYVFQGFIYQKFDYETLDFVSPQVVSITQLTPSFIELQISNSNNDVEPNVRGYYKWDSEIVSDIYNSGNFNLTLSGDISTIILPKNRDAKKVSVILYANYSGKNYKSVVHTEDLTPSYPCVWVNNGDVVNFVVPYVEYRGKIQRAIPVVNYNNKLYKIYNTDSELMKG